MTTHEIGLREARKILGPLANRAEIAGEITYLTRNGRRIAAIVPLDLIKESAVITLYETNSDLLVLARGAVAWDMGAPGASPGYLEGTFAQDAHAWAEGDWEPGESDGQMPTQIDDDLTAVAEWTPEGVRLLVDYDAIGGAAKTYLGEAVEPTTYTACIGVLSEVVAGDFCDVSVVENVIVGYREDDEGNEIPEYAAGATVVMEPIETSVRTDDLDPWSRLDDEAVRILAENGWRVIGDWEQSDNAAYARVERA